ncbi:MAG: benzoate-CoA ligase family protein [Planctomycetota bacterium]
MSAPDAVYPLELPDRFNLCAYFLDRNLDEGRGDKVAVRVGDEARTYAEIHEGVLRMAAALRGAGVREEDRVLIVLPDGFEFVEAWFATLRVGAVFAMVNPLLKAKDFEQYLAYTKATAVFTHTSVLPEIADALGRSPHCRRTFVAGDDAGGFTPYAEARAAADPAGDAAALAATGPDDLAGWLFTSGSTGAPKACVHVQRDFAYSTEHYALQVAGYREDDVCLSVPKLFFGYATGTNLMFPFRVGATVVLFEGRSTADELLDQIEAHRPTFLTGVPTLFNNVLRSERCAAADLSSLRVALSAGEALPPALYADWKERTGVEILDGIGSAEMFHIYISNRPDDVVPGSLGRLVPGYEAEVVGPDGAPVPDGEPGRLRVGGGSTALCYWGAKESSNATFQGAWCTTADVFRRDADGLFWYVGRGDDLLKVSGIWVSPLEIENVLLDHDAVHECCVVGREDDSGLVKAHAIVVCTAGHVGCDDLATSLKAHVKGRLAPHKYPRTFEWRDEPLPRNDRGKVARKLLK